MWLFLGSDSERLFRPAGWASLISCAVYSPVIMAAHYRAAALRETLEKLPALVTTSQKATPRHTAGTWPRLDIGRERAQTRQTLTQTQKHIYRLQFYWTPECLAAEQPGAAVGPVRPESSASTSRDRQCPLLSPIIWHNAPAVTLALMYRDGHTANSHPVPSSSARPQLARVPT